MDGWLTSVRRRRVDGLGETGQSRDAMNTLTIQQREGQAAGRARQRRAMQRRAKATDLCKYNLSDLHRDEETDGIRSRWLA